MSTEWLAIIRIRDVVSNLIKRFCDCIANCLSAVPIPSSIIRISGSIEIAIDKESLVFMPVEYV